MLAILIYPVIANLLQMTDVHFGIWAGAAIHDTSSVVAAGYAFSDEAGEVAIVVKLVRTLMLIPLALLIALYYSMKNRGHVGERTKLRNMFPYFILIFMLVALLNSVFDIPATFSDSMTWLAKFFIVMVMVSVGLKTDVRKIKQVGFKPLVVGLIASVLIGVISISLIYILV